MGKYSSFKKQQIITEAFRSFLNEALEPVGGGSYDSSGKWQGSSINRTALDHEEMESNRRHKQWADDRDYDSNQRRKERDYQQGRDIFHADPKEMYEKGAEGIPATKNLSWEQLNKLDRQLERRTGLETPMKYHLDYWGRMKEEEEYEKGRSNWNPFNWFD